MKIKVISFNIQHGRTVGFCDSVIGGDLAAENADLVGLQEVDRFTARNGNRDTLREIAEAAGYAYYAYAKSMDYMGGAYGTGILSKYPIQSFSVLPLESCGYEPRAVGIAEIELGGKRFTYLNTHLSFENDEVRKKQFEILAGLVAGKPNYLITGDFNTEIFSEFDRIPDAQLLNRAENRLPSHSGTAIDNIVFPSTVRLISSFVRSDVVHSDHYMIGGEFEI